MRQNFTERYTIVALVEGVVKIYLFCTAVSFLYASPSTGLFTASVIFDTPLISDVDGPILKLFGVVIVISVTNY